MSAVRRERQVPSSGWEASGPRMSGQTSGSGNVYRQSDVSEVVDEALWVVIVTAYITGTSPRKVDETAAPTARRGSRE